MGCQWACGGGAEAKVPDVEEASLLHNTALQHVEFGIALDQRD